VNEPSPIGRVGGPGEARATNGDMSLWPDMTDFHGRFEQIQSEFIEDPKSAVTKAEKLMEEMLDHMMRSMHERMQSMHRDIESEKTDTEQLRLTMRGYKEFINSLAHREAA
jgi:lipoate-protein ligase A